MAHNLGLCLTFNQPKQNGYKMKEFFYPERVAVFGVANSARNLAKNIVEHCLEMGFKGEIYPVGRKKGSICGRNILTDPDLLPNGIDLAVILVPAPYVAKTLEICGRKGIRHAIISTGGFREFTGQCSETEEKILEVTRRYGIRFIGPNCIGVICPSSGLCTPFNPIQPHYLKSGPVGLIIQSGGVTTQASYHFSEEHVGFSKIISAGNKLDLNENDFIEYFLDDDDTKQIHLYLESIDEGRKFMKLVKGSTKPIVVFKANVSRAASCVAYSHTAALANNDMVVDGALKQSGVIRVNSLHEMVVAAKALMLPPLRGNRLAVLSFSGGFSVVLADACEKHGFVCPTLPDHIISKLEKTRRAGVIRLNNPMDLGDIHDPSALLGAIETCIDLDYIDGLVLALIYDAKLEKIFGQRFGTPEQILDFLQALSRDKDKPITFSILAHRSNIEEFKKVGSYPVFDSPEESVFAMRILAEHWSRKAHFMSSHSPVEDFASSSTGSFNAGE